jgi:hypothetical protein
MRTSKHHRERKAHVQWVLSDGTAWHGPARHVIRRGGHLAYGSVQKTAPLIAKAALDLVHFEHDLIT